MGNEIKYRCKDFGKNSECKGEVIISKRVHRLMAERGESLPERCDTCRKMHRSGKRETRQSYIPKDINLPLSKVSRFNFSAVAFTPHKDRNQTQCFIKPDSSEMKIKITDDHIKELYEKLERHQVVVLASPTGTGKSVYVLYRLLEASPDYQGRFVKDLLRQGQVIQTQPLSYATECIPETVSSKMLGESCVKPMGVLGIRHRGRKDYSRHNLGVVVTDGSLKNWIRDGDIGQYSLIMVDEAHKRSVNIDNLLSLLQYKLPLYPHLKVIIASATINIDEFKNAFERNGISTGILDLSLTLEEKINYHVHYWKGPSVKNCDCWLCANDSVREKFWKKKGEPPEEAELPAIISSYILEILQNTEKGGILAFLTGESVIEKTREILEEKIKRMPALRNKVLVLPIYSRLGEAEVSKRFNYNPEAKRVLLTTDIAETSHTLKDILYVIESGYIKQFQWDPEDMTSTLPTIRHSQAGCRQRFGRVGRTQKGYVYCLYREEEFKSTFKMQTTPEIFRSPIDETLLTVNASGISQEPQFIGAPDNRSKFNSEIKRANSVISSEGYTDEIGNITDEGLDIFRVPLSPQKKALLDLADEQGCLLEMITFLSMLETVKSDPRTGAESYNVRNGLLVWDPRWTATTKMNVWRVHEALKTGCMDDLDFVLKLAYCYLDSKEKGKEAQWIEQNFLNQTAFEDIFEFQKSLLQIFLSKAEDRQLRKINLVLVSKIRLILSSVLKDRLVSISKSPTGNLVYSFHEDQDPRGIIPESCVGVWQDGDNALLITATKKKSIFNGRQKPVSNACFLARLESSKSSLDDNAADQKIFVGSKVSVGGNEGSNYIENILQKPPQINVEYGEKLDFAMIMDDYLPKGFKPSIKFDDAEAREKFQEFKSKINLIWQDDRRDKEAKIIGWRIIDNSICAIAVPFDEKSIIRRVMEQEKAKVRINKVFKSVQDKKGWILGETKEGFEIPIECSDLSLSHLISGMKYLEGSWLELDVKSVNVQDRPLLSNIEKIIKELEVLRDEIISSGEIELDVIVDSINDTKNFVMLFTISESNSVYSFSTKLRFIPEWLKIGDKVSIIVGVKDGRSYEYCYLEDYQSESMPEEQDWEYDPESEQLFFPYFLDQEKVKYFDIDEEDKERIIKKSWLFGFRCRINFSGNKS